MRQPRTPEELQIVKFVDADLDDLPPRLFSLRPVIAQWLLQERPVVAALTTAATMPYCDFQVHTGGNPFPDLEHLPEMQRLTERALATAKAYEYAENQQGTAGIYYGLFQLVENLDQDRNLTSGLRAADLLQSVFYELEGFLSRDPSENAMDILADFFRDIERPVFHLGDYILQEGQRLGRWLMEDPLLAERRLARLYGRAAKRPAIDKLVTLSPQRKERRLQDWVMEYESWMIRLADAMQQPYDKAHDLLEDLTREKEKLKAKEDAPGVNPLIPLLVPSLDEVYDRFMLAEAQFSMARILTMAGLYRARNGRWPIDLQEIETVTIRPLPDDPFNDKSFYYKLVKLRPRIITRVPRWLARNDGYIYLADLARRRKQDERRFADAYKIYREQVNASIIDINETEEPVR
jgi:hypothetical protein